MAFAILYSVRDSKGKSSTMEINIPENIALPAVVAFATDVALLINDVISGVITRIGIAVTMNLPGGLRTSPVANSDVEEGARFQFRTANGFHTAFRVPTFLDTLIANDSRAVNVADTDVAALIAGMISGIDQTGTLVSPSDKRSEDVVALVSAQEQFMSSRG